MARVDHRTVVSRRLKYVVLLFWLAVVAIAVPAAGQLTGAEDNATQSWLPADAESTKVLDLESAFQSPNLLSAVIVYHRANNEVLTEGDRDKIASDARRDATVAPLAGRISGPIWSADGKAAIVIVPTDLGPNGWREASGVVNRFEDIARTRPGLLSDVTGPAGYAAASSDAFKGIDGTLLFGTIFIVIVILLLTYRSPILWVFPVLSAGVALVAAEALIDLLARHAGLTVNALSVGILTVLVFGAGTDYALLLVARYREELRRHEDRHRAMARALRRASPAIVASASTVILGLLCLVFAENNSTRGLGPVAAIGVTVALSVMLTLLPALLVMFDRWVFWPARPDFGSPDPTVSGPWARVGRRIAHHPRRVWVATALGLTAMAAGLLSLHASGLTNSQSYRNRPAAVVGEQLVDEHFPPGVGSPVIVIADAKETDPVREAFAGTPGIEGVTAPEAVHGKIYLQGTLAVPPDSDAADRVIDDARTRVHAVPGAHALVGGNTAINLDVERAAARDRDVIIPIVLLVVFVVLSVLLRAILAPLLLIATVVLSLAAALGFSALVFTHVFGFAGADTSLPLYVFVFLVALGIDYNIFLMSRVREESQRIGTRAGAVSALAATGGVITSAGFVLAGTFSVLATLPLTTFTEVGFAVCFGVLLDTIVVRSVLVTALNTELGDAIWWPRSLHLEDRARSVEQVSRSAPGGPSSLDGGTAHEASADGRVGDGAPNRPDTSISHE